jgi:uncharacterized RDD family membrane protein YckC
MYFLSLDSKQAGPFPLEHLQAGWRDGTLPPETLFWQEGMDSWQSLESIRALLEKASPATTGPAPMIIAGFWRRVAAFLIDVLFIGLIGFGSGYFLFNFYMSLGLGGILLGLAVATLYFGLLNSSLAGGQTFGKRVLGTRVEDAAGNLISPGRSILRYLVLAFPFFLNKAVSDGLFANIWGAALLTVPVFAGFAAFTYLLIFNRGTRQLVHDLWLGTYVVRASSPRPAIAPVMWRGHAIVVAALCLIALGLAAATPFVARMSFFQGILAVRQAIMSTGDVRVTSVSGGSTYVMQNGQTVKTSIFLILAHVKSPPTSAEAEGARFVRLAIQADPTVAAYDHVNVSISFGYDIGIASGVVTDQYTHTPDEWRLIADQPALP